MTYKQYEVILVNLNPTVGKEIQKTRPYIILSPNEMNFENLMVAPMTSTDKDYPTRIKIDENSFVVLDRIRTISKKRVIKKLEIKIKPKHVKEIKNIIKIMLVD